MRIVFLLPGYPAPIGGFRVIYEYANKLAINGYDVSIVHAKTLRQTKKPKNLYRLLRRKVALFMMDHKKKQLNWLNLDKKINMIYVKNLHENNVPDADIIVASSWQTAEYMNSYRRKNVKKFYIVMDFPPFMGSKEEIESTWNYDCSIITISSWLYDKVKKVRGEKNLINIPIGIPLDKYNECSKIERNKYQICMMFNDGKYKAAYDGIKALSLVCKKFNNVNIILYGKNNPPKDLPSNFTYMKNISEEKLINIYRSSSIFVSSSIAEGFGLPSAEAMACGCAVASTNCGGNQDFAIHNYTALISEPRDVEDLFKNIVKLLEDDKLRNDIAKNSLKHIKDFNWDRAGDSFINFLLSKV